MSDEKAPGCSQPTLAHEQPSVYPSLFKFQDWIKHHQLPRYEWGCFKSELLASEGLADALWRAQVSNVSDVNARLAVC